MKMAYKPEKINIEVPKPKLFAVGHSCFVIVDQANKVNIFFKLRFI